MTDAHDARRANVSLTYDGVNISEDLAPYLISFTYTDNADNKADDLSITLEDREGKWRDPWFPSKGATLTPSIITRDWNNAGAVQSFPLGLFEIDQIECSGPPTQVSVKAVSTLIRTTMRQKVKNKTWENMKLSAILGDVAGSAGLSLFFDSPVDPFFKRRDQIESTDLMFATELAKQYGLGVKVADGQLIVYHEETWEKKGAGGTIRFGDGRIKSYKFSTKTAGKVKKLKNTYDNIETGEVYTDESGSDVDGTEDEAVTHTRSENDGMNASIADGAQHKQNRSEQTANITLFGTFGYSAGRNINVSGWGKFDGKYFIDKVTHSISRSGYTTTLDLRVCVGGKKKSGGDSMRYLDYEQTNIYYEEQRRQGL